MRAALINIAIINGPPKILRRSIRHLIFIPIKVSEINGVASIDSKSSSKDSNYDSNDSHNNNHEDDHVLDGMQGWIRQVGHGPPKYLP